LLLPAQGIKPVETNELACRRTHLAGVEVEAPNVNRPRFYGVPSA
jgi:hypothetical protein